MILEKQDAVFWATSSSELRENRHTLEREQLEDLCCAIRMRLRALDKLGPNERKEISIP